MLFSFQIIQGKGLDLEMIAKLPNLKDNLLNSFIKLNIYLPNRLRNEHGLVWLLKTLFTIMEENR